jgi:hypothetical protein
MVFKYVSKKSFKSFEIVHPYTRASAAWHLKSARFKITCNMLRMKHQTSVTLCKSEREIQVESDLVRTQNEEKHYLENHVNKKDLEIEDNR